MSELSDIRVEIDKIDRRIVELYEQRLQLTSQVAEYKMKTGKAVYDPEREAQKLDTLAALASSERVAGQVRKLFQTIMDLSKEQQRELMS